MIIAVDVDGVVADLHHAWLARYNHASGDSLTAERLTCWDISRAVLPSWREDIYRFLNARDLYDDVPAVAGALEGVQALRAGGHRVVFATSANINQMGPKLLWLANHGFVPLPHGTTCPDYITAHDKGLVRADVLIDDGLHNLERFAGRRIVFDQPWNQAALSDTDRALGWPSAVRLALTFRTDKAAR